MSLPLHRVRRRSRWRPFRRPFDPALILYLPFFEGSGDHVTDESRYGNHGSWTPGTWTEGKLGPAPLFDGVDDYVDCEAPSVLNVRTHLTVTAWIKPKLTGDVNQGVCCKDSNVDRVWWLRTFSNTPNFTVKNVDDVTAVATADDALVVDVWTHLAGTYDGEKVRLYVNGDQVKTATLTGLIKSSTDKVWMGVYFTVTSNKYKGIIAEVRIYKRALEPHEILALYRATV